MKILQVALVLTLALVNVADAKSLFGKEEKNFGKPISQSQCQTIARKHVEPYLRNPSAARYQWGTCEATTMKPFVMQKLPMQSGYGMHFKVNSTNKWGKYTGYTDYVILIRDGEVIRRMRQSDRGSMQKY